MLPRGVVIVAAVYRANGERRILSLMIIGRIVCQPLPGYFLAIVVTTFCCFEEPIGADGASAGGIRGVGA